MNKSNWEKLLNMVIVVLVGVLVVYGLYWGYQYFFGKEYGIIKQVSVDNLGTSFYKDFYLTKYSGSIKGFDLDGNLLFKYEADIEDFDVFENYVIVEEEDEYNLIDLEGKVKFNGKLIQTIGKYLYVDDSLYNENLEKLWDFRNIDNYSSLGRYLVINCEDGYYLLDTDTDKLVDVYKNKEVKDNYTMLSNSNSRVIVINDKIYTSDIEEVNDEYFMDFSACDNGATLNNNDGVVISGCYYDYEVISDGVFFAYGDDTNNLYVNGNLENTGEFSVEGDYINGYVDDNYVTYDLKGNNIDFARYVYNVNEDVYIIELNDNYYFANNDLDYYGDAFSAYSCKLGWCSITKMGRDTKNIYYNGKEVSEERFRSISVYEGYIVAKSLYNTYDFVIGNGKLVDISLLNDKPGDVNIDEVIEKYELEDIKSNINEYSDLFLKYAYIVENNDKISEFRKYVMDMFRVVINNTEYLDEYELLCGLYRLKIEVGETNESTNGLSYNSEARIVIAEVDEEIIYHELIHFIDRYISSNYDDVYWCSDKYVYKSDVDDISKCQLVEKGLNDFMVEAGAELESCKYFELVPNGYVDATRLYSLMEYIMGSDEMDKMFYSGNTDNEMMMLVLNSGYSYDEYLELDKSLDHLSDAYYDEDTSSDYIKVFDFLFKLYKDKGNDFRTDNAFKFMLANLCYKRDFSSSKYYEEIKDYILDRDDFIDFIDSVIKPTVDRSYYALYIPLNILVDDNAFYIYRKAEYYPDGVTEVEGNIFITIDPNKLTATSYEFKETPSKN